MQNTFSFQTKQAIRRQKAFLRVLCASSVTSVVKL